MSTDAHGGEALRVLIAWYRAHRPHNCFYCGRALLTRPKRSSSWPRGRPKPNQRTMDHVTPRTHGGADHDENKVACCHPCNGLKAFRTLEAFRHFVMMEQHFHGTPGGQLKLVDQKFYGEREYEARKN